MESPSVYQLLCPQHTLEIDLEWIDATMIYTDFFSKMYCKEKQVLNPKKGVSGTHSFKLRPPWVSIDPNWSD